MRTRLTLRPLDGEPRDLAIEGGLFVAHDRPADQELATQALFALPGLADCHAHLGADSLDQIDQPGAPEAIARRAFAQLKAGVFLVVDKGWRDEAVLSLLDKPPNERPDLQAAGRIIASPSGYYRGFADEVEPAGLTEAVARAARPGGWVKIIGDWPRKGRGLLSNFPEQPLADAIDAAHRLGLRVALHTMGPEMPSIGERTGVDSVEHGLFLSEEDLARLGTRGGAWIPTVAGMEAALSILGVHSRGGRAILEGLGNFRRLLPQAKEAGVILLAGTDLSLPHGRVALEAARMVAYGLSPEGAVHAISEAALRFHRIERCFEPGQPADAVLFDQDPRLDVGALQQPALVIRRGLIQ